MYNCAISHVGDGRIFPGRDQQRNFPGVAKYISIGVLKVVKFDFTRSGLRKQPFLANISIRKSHISKSRERPPSPPFPTPMISQYQVKLSLEIVKPQPNCFACVIAENGQLSRLQEHCHVRTNSSQLAWCRPSSLDVVVTQDHNML